MTVEELYAKLRGSQEPLGYFFNKDMDLVMDLLKGLLINKERYGYMACPCRLASGNQELDADIICPCEYRGQDVAAYGSCYCGLYVSKGWNQGRIRHRFVPERRPAERVQRALRQAASGS
jgi:ferredoxin-thioredoxin reductase catalytic subunit